MSYNKEAFPKYMQTAGKISVFASIVGLAVFLFAFMVDVGQQELQRVSAQTATTSLTVLNTPPVFTLEPYEVTPSTTTTPTNSGDDVTWSAIGTDSNGAPYFLLVCSTNASPTANAAAGPGSLGTAPPDCGGGVQWAVSTGTVSGTLAVAATTTVEVADDAGTNFLEENDWYAWVCDDDPTQPACNPIPSQGLYATSSSPFNMNQRPVLSAAGNSGPVDPASALTFTTTSSDPDSSGGQDDLRIVVCQLLADYNPVTNDCDSNFVASTTVLATDNVTAATTTAAIIRDGSYPAVVFLLDEHGHEANPNGTSADFVINNVAPTLVGGDIDLNGGADMVLTVPNAETTGFTLDFVVSDANSCVNASAGDEITGFEVALYHSPTHSTSTTCDPGAADYDPNFCYTTGVATSTWDLDCTASSTSCTGATDDTQLFECTFPLWFLTNPTDNATVVPPFEADSWVAAVAGADDNFATSSLVATTIPVEVDSASYIDLITAVIPYGALAPGDDTGTLSTTTTILNVGNTGLDQEVDGSAMCPPFVSTSTDCSLTTDSTIFTSSQQFSSTSLAYGSPLAVTLPTTTVALPAEVELDIEKTTSTTTPQQGDTYWGIAVPSAITIAGAYTGLNTFMAVTAEAVDWTP